MGSQPAPTRVLFVQSEKAGPSLVNHFCHCIFASVEDVSCPVLLPALFRLVSLLASFPQQFMFAPQATGQRAFLP